VKANSWFGVSVYVNETHGNAVICTFDDEKLVFSSNWSCSFDLYDPSSGELYYLEVGPVLSISRDEFVFAQYGGTSFQSSSLVKVDTKSRTCTQGPVTNTGLYHILKYDDVKNVIIGVRDIETWTIVYEEVDVVTLKATKVLYTDTSKRGNAPQGFGAYYNSKSRLLGHVVEVDYFDNYWHLLNFSVVPTVVPVYNQFATNWPPSAMAYDPQTNLLVALYQNSANDPKNGEPQAFFIDPISGSWPLQGTKVHPLSISNVPEDDVPVQTIDGKLVMLLMMPESSQGKGDCSAMLLDFSSLARIRGGPVTCLPFGREGWNLG